MGNIQKGVGVIGNRNFIGRTKWAQAKYDFAVDGGTVGDIIPVQSDTIPSGAFIVDAMLITDTVVTGATATLAVKVEGAADIQSAAAISGAPWSTTGARRASFTATTAPVTTTAARQITMTVGTAATTAGVVRVIVAYVEVAA